MKITPDLFHAYSKCPMKCWMRSTGEPAAGNTYSEWTKAQNDSYCANAIARLFAELPNDEVALSPDLENLKAAKWRWAASAAVQAHMDSCDLESELHAVERVPSEGRGKPAQFIPIRFVFTNKLDKDDKLLLAFDAFVLSEALGREISLGKIIHGDDHATLKVKTSSLTSEVRKRVEKITALLASSSPPDLVLNRHCIECEFQTRCRQKAIEKDDLSLLSNMSEKERKELHSKGIFTVTQLSYTFRPRRRPKKLRDKREKYHHSLKALAIREKKIHIVGSPELKIEGTPVYLDVEGLPDRDFYYLIGVRIGNGESAVQHSLWAETVEDEGKIWREFLAILESVNKPILVHYGSFEISFLKRMCKRYGELAGSNAAKAVKCSVNLLSVIFAQVYFPAFSNGLKDTAGFLGFKWTAVSSGLHTIALRHYCENGQDTSAKERILRYNAEDCLALKQVTDHLQLVSRAGASDFNNLIAVDDLVGTEDFGRWGQRKFAMEDFRMMADCAYFDYQRDKIYIRSNPEMKHVYRRKRERAEARNRPNKVVVLRARQCWRCKSREIVPNPDRWHRKLHLDLRISSGGIRKWITEYRVPFYSCPQCKGPCFSRSYKSKRRFGHDLMVWVMHQHLTNRLSFENLHRTLRECFGIHLACPSIQRLKYQAARYYKQTYNQILRNILTSRLIHADETKMKLVTETGYVWVFTSLFDVAYMYRPTREGDFLREMLKGFSGVLITDFYSVYDSLECEQQKCLVHLMWDINADLLKKPFDDELKDLAARFGRLLRDVIQTVDRFGLKARFLRKHKKEVTQFYTAIELRQMASTVAQRYRERFLKCREKLFVFLDHDGVPWNNNNAEHAIKPIAKYRPMVKRAMQRKGVESYLVLLSIYQTCQYQGLSFLEFLHSGEKDINAFAKSRRARRRGTQTNRPTDLPANAIPDSGDQP